MNHKLAAAVSNGALDIPRPHGCCFLVAFVKIPPPDCSYEVQEGVTLPPVNRAKKQNHAHDSVAVCSRGSRKCTHRTEARCMCAAYAEHKTVRACWGVAVYVEHKTVCHKLPRTARRLACRPCDMIAGQRVRKRGRAYAPPAPPSGRTAW
jgi:hypothetical protein